MKYITHPLVRPESLEERRFQLTIALHALEGNTMVVLPTGLGKTAIVSHRGGLPDSTTRAGGCSSLPPRNLSSSSTSGSSRGFSLYPTGTKGIPSPFVMFTGDTPPEERKAGWTKSRACFATPQAVKNDLLAGRYTLSDVSLLVVDECHRAVGNYAYVFIARRYMETAGDPPSSP